MVIAMLPPVIANSRPLVIGKMRPAVRPAHIPVALYILISFYVLVSLDVSVPFYVLVPGYVSIPGYVLFFNYSPASSGISLLDVSLAMDRLVPGGTAPANVMLATRDVAATRLTAAASMHLRTLLLPLLLLGASRHQRHCRKRQGSSDAQQDFHFHHSDPSEQPHITT
jgi:hypothetical protein